MIQKCNLFFVYLGSKHYLRYEYKQNKYNTIFVIENLLWLSQLNCYAEEICFSISNWIILVNLIVGLILTNLILHMDKFCCLIDWKILQICSQWLAIWFVYWWNLWN